MNAENNMQAVLTPCPKCWGLGRHMPSCSDYLPHPPPPLMPDFHDFQKKQIQKQAQVAAGALQKQVGGNHYKTMPLQPWEIIDRNGLDFWQGNAIKYVMRYKDKGGVEDLKKAIHYIEYLIERYQRDQLRT